MVFNCEIINIHNYDNTDEFNIACGKTKEIIKKTCLFLTVNGIFQQEIILIL